MAVIRLYSMPAVIIIALNIHIYFSNFAFIFLFQFNSFISFCGFQIPLTKLIRIKSLQKLIFIVLLSNHKQNILLGIHARVQLKRWSKNKRKNKTHNEIERIYIDFSSSFVLFFLSFHYSSQSVLLLFGPFVCMWMCVCVCVRVRVCASSGMLWEFLCKCQSN